MTIETEVNNTFENRCLSEIREQMLQFALLQLGDRHLAEDAVQQALEGALKGLPAFSGKSALKTWIFAILKHKIADALRHQCRLVSASELMMEEDESNDFNNWFDRLGRWQKADRPLHLWSDPESCLIQEQFWMVFTICLEDLPPRHARVFMMREYLGLNIGEIARVLDQSPNNIHVIMHRARLRLQECLQIRWFNREVAHV